MAENLGGHLATLDENCEGELRDIYTAAKAKAIEEYGEDMKNLVILKYMGQAMLGCRNAKGARVYNLGHVAYLASFSLFGNSFVRSLFAHRDASNVHNNCHLQKAAISSVVVIDTFVSV